MAKITLVLGVLLGVFGLWAYFGAAAERPSPTALIPAVVGGLLAGCGALGLKPAWRKHAMHAAATVSLLGALAATGRLVAVLAGSTAGAGSVNWRAMGSVLVLAAACFLHLALSIKSFIDARRRQAAARTDAWVGRRALSRVRNRPNPGATARPRNCQCGILGRNRYTLEAISSSPHSDSATSSSLGLNASRARSQPSFRKALNRRLPLTPRGARASGSERNRSSLRRRFPAPRLPPSGSRNSRRTPPTRSRSRWPRRRRSRRWR